MKRVLIISVGGSPQPVINAIKFYAPEFVYFFCSLGEHGSAVTVDGSGYLYGNKKKSRDPNSGHEDYSENSKGKSIVSQAGLDKDKYELVGVKDPDDLNECYSVLIKLSEQIKKRYPDAQIIANYTGGTKTMSVAMGLVGTLTQEWDLSLNKGPRLDIVKVRNGDTPVVINKWKIFGEQTLKSAVNALKSYDYALAEAVISEILLHRLEPDFQKKLLKVKLLCEAFNLWDKFDHKKALELLKFYDKEYYPYIIVLKKILRPTKSSGYELVSDLINNAERCAARSRYDDGIARLYRATELFAQVRLEKKIKGCELGKLKLEELPEKLRADYEGYTKESGKLLLGLREDYELLFKLNDPVGDVFKENENRIIDALKYRNSSILAHGLTPLKEKDYKLVNINLRKFLSEAAKKINITLEQRQLPREEIIQ